MTAPYPRYYAVNDRPVKLDLQPTGELVALVVDPVTGQLVRDMSYLPRTVDHGVGKDVDSLTALEFEARRIALWHAASSRRLTTPVVWERTSDAEFPYQAELSGHTLLLRVNDFPAEPLYTLLIDGIEAEDLEDWPTAWVRPGRQRTGPVPPDPTPSRDGR